MNAARTGLLLAAMTALFLAVGFLIGGRTGLVIALVLALGTNAFAYWNADKAVLAMHRARPVDAASAPDLYRLVADLARRGGLPTPRVFLIATDQPNAFATGRDPDNAAVAVTRGLLTSCTREELAGVVAHELAHIRNRDTLIMTVTATLAGAIGFLSQFAFLFGMARGDGQRTNPIATLLVALFAPLAAMLVQTAISRTREFSADRDGASICGHPLWLASALARIEQAASGRPLRSADANPATAHLFIVNPLHGGLSTLFSTHPPTSERIARLRALAPGAGGGPRAPYPEEPPGDGGPWGRRAPPRSGARRPGPWGR